MKNLFKTTSENKNFAEFIWFEGRPNKNETIDDPTKKTPEKGEEKNKKEAEVVASSTEAGKSATESNNSKVDLLMEQVEELGMAELLNETQINKISEELNNILDNPENLEKIRNRDIGITVYGAASHEKFSKLKYTVDNKEIVVKNNWELAKLRADISEEIVRRELAKRGIYNSIIRKEIPVGETDQDGVAQNDKRLSGVALFKMDTTEGIVNNYNKIVIDRSGSMENDKEMVKEAEKQGKADNLILKKRSGDILEQHLSTIAKNIKDMPKNSSIIILTDEKDDWGSENFGNWRDRQIAYIKKFQSLKSIANEKNIQVVMKFINPDNTKETITFDFFRNNLGANMVQGNEDKKTWNQIKRMSNYFTKKEAQKYSKDVLVASN